MFGLKNRPLLKLGIRKPLFNEMIFVFSRTSLSAAAPEVDDCRNIRLLSDSAERKACIDDLLHFVSEISLAEQGSLLMTAKDREQVN
jgi:hypothetical protein